MNNSKLAQIRDEAERLRQNLNALYQKEQEQYKSKLQDEIENISRALEESKVPESFKVAVVGQFKSGKSSFINCLIGQNLAGVETNPETAAITTFRHGISTKAFVKMLSMEEWLEMENIHKEDPTDPRAYRIKGLYEFNEIMEKNIKNKSGDSEQNKFEKIDANKLINTWITSENLVHEIELKGKKNKADLKVFRKGIQRFTSTKFPEHYFVKEIVVDVDAEFLDDKIELIDTPGLNDTQLYRGQLTEDLLSDVDVILLLSRSGASFSQFDKEFLIRQLRKKRVRQVHLIVTQIDETLNKAEIDASDNDEDKPELEDIKEKEKYRLKTEISRTLEELLDNNKLSDEDGYRYIEQLEGIQILFTSAKWHKDGDKQRAGITEVKDALLKTLTENYRIDQLEKNLQALITNVRTRLSSFFQERISLLQSEFDTNTVNDKLKDINVKLTGYLIDFKSQMNELSLSHSENQDSLQKLIKANIDGILLQAQIILKAYEMNDSSLHWKTRRYGNWGFLNELGNQIADRIFPKIEQTLQELVPPFEQFISSVKDAVKALENKIDGMEMITNIEGLPKINFVDKTKRYMESKTLQIIKDLEKEKDSIIMVLEDFVADEDFKNTLQRKRSEVEDIIGRGTTIKQTNEVQGFYEFAKIALNDTLEDHLDHRIKAYSESLRKKAETVYPELHAIIEATFTSRQNAIRESINLKNEEDRKQRLQYLTDGINIASVNTENNAISITILNESKIIESKEMEIEIDDDATGYSYEGLFWEYLSEAEWIQIDEPYLSKKYQLNNFQRFCEMLCDIGKVEEILLNTLEIIDPEDKRIASQRIEAIKISLIEKGISFKMQTSRNIHNRQIRTSNGWLILSDRGLDIYKPLESKNAFGLYNQALRKCKQTKIHIRKSL